jgi:CBS domain-containing protein
MNIAFFLTPKAEVAWVSNKSTIRQALERMEHHRYTAVPVLTGEGVYDGTLTEGDLLWYMKNNSNISFRDTEKILLTSVPRRQNVRAIDINAEIEQLFNMALDQNFVPVVDDRQVFIGIVRRKSILQFFAEKVSWTVRNTQ